MEKKSYLVLCFYKNQLIEKPYIVLEESEAAAMNLVVRTDLAVKGLLKPDIDLMVFDIENDCIYLGTPNEDDLKRLAEDSGNGCYCPNGEACDHYMFGGCTFECCGGGDDAPNDPPEGFDDVPERIYSASELIFAVAEAGDFAATEFIAFLMLREEWEKYSGEGKLDYPTDLGGHNVDNAALEAGGLCVGELMESIFEVHRGSSKHEIITNMLEAGFGYAQAYQDKVDSKEDWG
jgi:hypothetical protein